jgi:hypothetical protein
MGPVRTGLATAAGPRSGQQATVLYRGARPRPATGGPLAR